MPAEPNIGPAELDSLVRQVETQLAALQAAPDGTVRFRGAPAQGPAEIPAAPQQQAVIEQASGKPFESFWQRYKRHARRQLCLPGGMLYEQWQQWRDLRKKDAVKMSLAALAGMGVSTANIPAAAVAATVFLLNAVVTIGIEAVCENCAEEEAEREKARREAAGGQPDHPRANAPAQGDSP